MKVKKIKRLLKVEKSYFRLIDFLARFRKTFVILVILLFGLPVFYLPSKIDGWDYYNRTIGSLYYQEQLKPHVDKWLGGSLRMFVKDVFEKSGYRSAEKTVLYVKAQMNQGNTLQQMDRVIRAVEKYLQTVDGLEKFVTNVWSGELANVAIYFKPEYEETSLPYVLKSQLVDLSLKWGGVEWDIYGVGKGFSNSGADEIPRFRVEMRGYNFDELGRQANSLATKLLSHKRIQKVNTNEKLSFFERTTGEFVLRFDDVGLPVSMSYLPAVFSGINLRSKPTKPDLQVTIDNIVTPLIVVEREASGFSKYNLLNDPIIISDNNYQQFIKVKTFGTVDFETATNAIHKEDRLYIRHVAFDYLGSQHFGEKFLEEKLEELSNEMPLGYTAVRRFFSWNYDKTKRQYSLLLILIIVIFFICSILFESLKQPLIIIATIPVSFIGLFLVFALFDFYFDQGGYASFLLLGGLVVNAAIFVFSDYKNLQKIRSQNRRIIKAIMGKTRPIMLTLLSTIFGLTPFLIEGQGEVFWFSLAIGTIGGLIFSLFSLFIFLPVAMWRKSR